MRGVGTKAFKARSYRGEILNDNMLEVECISVGILFCPYEHIHRLKNYNFCAGANGDHCFCYYTRRFSLFRLFSKKKILRRKFYFCTKKYVDSFK